MTPLPPQAGESERMAADRSTVAMQDRDYPRGGRKAATKSGGDMSAGASASSEAANMTALA